MKRSSIIKVEVICWKDCNIMWFMKYVLNFFNVSVHFGIFLLFHCHLIVCIFTYIRSIVTYILLLRSLVIKCVMSVFHDCDENYKFK
ncbi:hypothetical protein C2G38_1504281 [Gigaspora rosea]|uniref:Uncharacterized protein n=1 Tax=Gigaspora rosea TaxID=44941 RepID=A0A397W9Z8_9GLOM|nr:hypothetical protein C2G38_1504281 [Gigaspora rosea]